MLFHQVGGWREIGGGLSPEGRATIQRDPDRLEEQADGNLTKFSEEKCKALPLGKEMPPVIQAGDRLAGEQPCGKDPGDPGGQRAEREALTAETANSIPGYISMAKRLREVIVPPLLLPRPYL